MSALEDGRPFAQQLSNVYFTILSLFCFKLFVKISLAILSHFYIVKGNRKEAARIAAEFYGAAPGQVAEAQADSGTQLLSRQAFCPSSC
ncbi:Ankyrin repeat and SOCS box protein 5 [Myotis brandtii]|uniref:Ankyrin repeat and SOCS box protein 5 n=1 Tax=Myotis brandtii TaxID=109478 RepID=S7NAD4_MYOBR|nr:Ankyrin repeat and SOCS box protein 5 [Myotis brandtii]